MSIISTVITKYCTAHATDSLLTKSRHNGAFEPLEWEQSKIISVPQWRGAMTYWGLATCEVQNWSTFDWLKEQVKEKRRHNTAEEFAQGLTDRLNSELSKMHFNHGRDSGLGIHLSVYEFIEGYWIPELFLISNWTDPSYRNISSQVVLTRETYHTICGERSQPEHRESQYRLKVHKYLQDGDMIIYNNGDPIMFNEIATSIFKMLRVLLKRKKLASLDKLETHLAIARRPIEIIAKIQHDFCCKDARLVGGKPHDLAITPTGIYLSTTGDK